MQTVRILNATKGVVIAQRAQVAVSLGQRMKGLLGRKSLFPDEAIILKPCTSIHTWFMRFPLDVLFLDKQLRVIKLMPQMLPFRFSPLVWSSAMVIELPAGKIQQTQTQLGEQIEFQST